ncbi:hypothetical protein F0562_017426 [Nyssa sinensis]|uniref:Glycosyltransferase n=1 Tax=Nyssa sinensis TaxID=561372 RepID=A0A5J4ZET0_9ASTE|nr:hypothetical protein F0562_017426 [Nyssa sinensis]
MVHFQKKYHLLKKGEVAVVEDEESQSLGLVCGTFGYNKRTRPKLLSLLFLSLLSCSLILAPQLFDFPSNFSLLSSFGGEDDGVNAPLCSSISNGTICCDRGSIRSDICIMKGDVRTHSASSSIYLYSSKNTNGFIDSFSALAEDSKEEELQHEKIKPYTRKWETTVFFSTGGYTGNVYHEFNDGILPLYITSQHLNKKVVFVILEYHSWWITKYGNILSLLSDHPPIDFSGDKRTHCFPEAIVGLKIHDELTVDSSLMEGNKTIRDFRDLLDQAYWPRIRGLIQDEEHEVHLNLTDKLSLPPSSKNSIELKKPKLRKLDFKLKVLRPERTTELAKIYRVLNSSDVMIGVHGAAMTHFLFVKPGSVFIQVIPLGTEWAAETYYGEPAMKLGLRYIGYKILPRESSLYDDYDKNDPILRDLSSVAKKGWEYTKKIYLDHQNVKLNLGRFRKRLVRAYVYSFAKKNRHSHLQSL